MPEMIGRVLITGGTGFLGPHVVAAFREESWEAVPVGHKDADLRDDNDARHLVRYHRPDVVVHLAAVCGGIGANQAQPGTFFRDNMLMGIHVVDACLHAGVSRLVVAGSVCAYPLSPSVPFREEALWDGYPEPTNAAYGIAKRSLLVMLQSYRQQYGLNSCYLMPTNLYGPGDHFDLERGHVIPSLIRKCLEAKESGQGHVDLWGTGTATRDFLYVVDAAQAFVLAVQAKHEAGPLNLGSGREVSIRELAEQVAHVCGFAGELRWHSDRPDGQPRRVLDSSQAAASLQWRPTVPLEIGLREAAAWYQQQRSRTQAA